MKSQLIAIILFVAASLPNSSSADVSEWRLLPPSLDGRYYQLQVRLPTSYATAPTRGYPVPYVPAGNFCIILFSVGAGAIMAVMLFRQCLAPDGP